MPCEFSLEYASSFEPSSMFDRSSENAFGGKCQFSIFDESDLVAFNGKKFCPFHLPLGDDKGNQTLKSKWGFGAQARFSGLLAQYIEERSNQNKPIDLCGLVHWDRLTFAMRYSSDGMGGLAIPYENLPAIALDGAEFPRGVDFNQLHFAKRVYARNVTFGGPADFNMTRFSDEVDFSAAVFSDDANFFGAKFESKTLFGGARFRNKLVFASAEFSNVVDFSLRHFFGNVVPDHASDESIRVAQFHNAKFLGQAKFNDRQFLSGPNFREAQFSIAPEFHNSGFHQSATFDGAQFLDTSSATADHAYRTLKLAMERLGARDEQAEFFALEQQARAKKPSTPCSVKLFSYLYWLASDYGRSFVRPLLWLLAVTVLFVGAHALAIACTANGQTPILAFATDFTLEQLMRPFAIWSPGALTRWGFEVTTPAAELPIKLISTIYTLTALGLVALALLALRRRFKLD
ncbi:hypothetical protein HGQ98_04095 [Achromobacter ruhlandii]|uniref:Pentapeptide repeat-containing protein n=1 Tax=Achromobacter ruhlandii TaxID=72557 RepID=A0A848NEF7_9BURK|nr:pentapeptide repeat-containing protein [Achromobacter ruhlandii]NMU89062.1 hypothetical protein [Achromobacter ruhlandii]